MHESLVFQRLSVELSEFGAIDSTAFNSWKSVVTAQEKQASQTLDVTQHGNTTPHSNNGGYHSNNHYNNVTPHSNSAGYHTNNLQTNYTPHVDNAGYHTNNRSYTYYPHYDSSAYHYNNRSYTYYPHVDNSAYHYNNRQYTYTPHTDDAGYHYNTRKYTYTAHGNSRYHSNSGHGNTGSHSNYWYNHTNTTPHTNNRYTHGNTLYNGGKSHSDVGAYHYNTKGAHQDAMYAHKNTPGTHTNNRVNDPTGSHSNTAGSHSNSGGTTYTPHSNYAASHSNSGHGNYVPYNQAAAYHTNSGHGNYVPHSNGGDYHSNTGHGNYTPHSNTGASHSNTGYTQAIPHTNNATYHNNNGLHTNYVPHSNTRPHSNSAFDHQNYIPSKTHFFNVENDTLVKGTVSIGLFAFDKNNDGSGTQDTLSKTVKYTLSIRKVRNLDGSASASSWRTLLNASAQDVYDLNTIDPLGTGNSDPKATEGYYEIKAVAKNDSKTDGGVTKNYVGQEQVITVKVQQNTDPDISVTNGNEFIGFTFSAQGAMTSTGSYKSYSDKLYATAPVDKQAGLFVTVNMTDADVDNYQKAKVYLLKSDGTTIANTAVDVIWSNGSSVIQSGGSAKTGYAFIPYSAIIAVGDVNGIKVVVDLKDYYDSACTQEAGGHINRSNLSKSDSTIMLLNTDVTKPTITDSGNPTSWVKSANLSVSATDNKAGINRIQKPDGSWVSGSSASHVVNANGNYTFIAEDKAGNQTSKVINVTRVDSGAPSITLTPSTTAPTNQDVVITANVSDSVSGIAVQKWASGNQNASYFASAGTTFSGSFTVSSNNTYTVYAKDNAGNETVRTITVSNIDTIAPTAPSLSASTTVPTNQNVSVTITYPADATVKQYKIGSTGTWTNYSSAVVLSGNNTVYARGQDNAGNWSDESSLVVSNIDKTAPTAPTLSPSTTAPTNQNVSVTITYPSDANVKQYKIGSAGTWTTYSSAVVLSDNNTVYARCQDVAGNWSSESSLAVGNIDKIAPAVPTLSANTTSWTNQNVSVTISFPADADTKEYKIGSGSWTAYTTPVSISSNTTVYARAKDNAGNYSAEGSLAITNIDKTAPSITLTPSTTAPTNQDVTITANISDSASGIAVKKWASGSQTVSYFASSGTVLSGSTFDVSTNNTYTVYTKDNAGNETVRTITISNIDKVAPAKPTLSANVTTPTNKDVTITIAFPADADVKEYRIGTGNWTAYTVPVVVSSNTTVYARAKDEAGNWSVDASLLVSNIDKVAPVITIGSYNTNPTNQDITVTASTNEGTLNVTSHKFTENGSFEFIATDSAGNVTKRIVTITNIDKIAPDKPTLSASTTLPTNKDVSVTISYPADAVVKEYKIGSGNWVTYTDALVLSSNNTVYARARDNAGNYSVEGSLVVSNIDKIAPVITIGSYNTNPTNQDITVTATTNEGTLNATSHKFTENGSFEFVATDPAGNVTKRTVTITNIDKVAPVKPTLSANVTTPTNKDVTITINFPADAEVKEYKVGSAGTWTAYTVPVVVNSNTTVYARAKDEAGNWSAEGSLAVTNIDKVAPVITIGSYNTNPTNQDITVTATTNEGSLNATSHKFTENGSFEFVATDPAGNVTKRTVTITNIDKVAPNKPTLSASTTAWTNQNISVTVSFPDDAFVKQYKIGNNGTWTNYTTAVSLSSNDTVYARCQDDAGNWSTDGSLAITNIDKTAPSITLTPSTTAPTNQDVTITANISDSASGIAVKKWASGNQTASYFASSGTVLSGTTFDVSAINTYTVYTKDNAGNETVKTITVSNIDKIAPVKPTLVSSTTEPTNKDVAVTISYPSDAFVKEYKIGSTGTWTPYTAPIVLGSNNTVYARAMDDAGNWSGDASLIVGNIDKVAPVITIAPYITAPTNKDIVVTASTNEGNLNTVSHTFTENGSFEFVATDPAGNVTRKTVTISNIDKVAPNSPTFNASKTAPTNTDVSVTINYPSDATVKQYKIGANGTWQVYTAPIVFAQNDTVYAKAQDIAGNWSVESNYAVTNIDKVAPIITVQPYNTNPTNQDITVTVSTNEGTLNTTSHKFTENGSFEFVATDPAGNVTKKTVTISNIDKVAPNAPTLSVSTTAPTNKDVSVTITYPADAVVREYRVGSGNWTAYVNPVVLSSNDTVYARAKDNAGNYSEISSINVTNIDKIAPVITIGSYNTDPTNQDITVTASTNEGSLNATSHKFTENGSFTFVATDPAGNVTERVVIISNIDKIAPDAPTFKADKTVPTNTDVKVTISYPADAVVKEYRIGSTGTWMAYSTPIVLSSNNTVYARAKDNADNYSDVSNYVVSNIDKVAPVITIGSYNTNPTNQDITVTATTNEGTLNKTSHTFTENGSFEFVATDPAGNVTKRIVTINNIDKIAPVKPSISASTTAPTNKDVTVSINYPNDAVIREYKIGSGNWMTYTDALVLSSNTTVYARAKDNAGNWSEDASLVVSNIDKVAPVITIGSYNTNPTNQDIIVTATANEGTLNATSHKFTENGSFTFVATDPAGNVTERVVTITNIDKIAPNSPTFSASKTAPTNTDVTVTISYPADGSVKQYKIGSTGTWTTYTAHVVLSDNNTVYARTQDVAGNWSEVSSYNVNNIDKIAPIITIAPYNTNPTNQDIIVSATVNEGTLNAISHKFTENGSFEFVATDPAGNVTKKTVTISNIDKIAPNTPVLSADKTAPTNTDVRVTINYPSDAIVKEYKVGSTGTWTNYTTAVVLSSNNTVYARAKDNAGNWSTDGLLVVSNIDKVAPIITIAPYNTNPTNQDITVTATVNEGSLNTTSHTFTENGSFEFVATDPAGNISKTVITITNIDKIAPNAPTFNADKTTPTNTDVEVTINYPTDAVVKEYKIGTGNWTSYTNPVVLGSNNTVYARAKDNAGNYSEVSSYSVNNIDKIAPVITIASYVTAPTNQDIIVTASTNEGTLNATSHTFTQNGSFEFVATDIAGNVSKRIVTISNIDKIAPNTPVISADKTQPTNQNVTVSISYPSDAHVKQFKIGNGEWRAYTTTFALSDNNTVYARTQDVAGNWSDVTEYKVTNIDKVAPIITIAPYETKPTNQNVTVTASTNEGSLNAESYTFTENGSFTFIATDPAGNVTRKTVTITNIDKIAPNTPVLDADKTVPTNTDVAVRITYPSDANVKQYKVGLDGTWTTYSSPIVLSANETVYARCQDVAGNWSIEGRYTVSNIDKEVPHKPTFVANTTAPTNKDVAVTINFPADGHIKQYRFETGTWVNYTTPVVFSENGTVYARTQDIAGNWSEVSSYNVNNIDKIAPTPPKIQVLSYNVLIIDSSKDNQSGMDRYLYKLNDGEWLVYSNSVELPDGQYRIVAKAVDKAGNETSASLDYLVFKSALDKALDAVVKAENSQSQADVDTARPLVSALPNGSEKSGLQNRLAYVQGCIDKAFMRQELTQIQEDIAEDRVVEIPQVRTINAKVSNISMRAMALPSSVDRTDLDIHISDVELESMATEKVIVAEQTLLQADVINATNAVNKVKTSSVKTSLNSRLNIVQLFINGQNAFDEAVNTGNQDAVDRAWDVVDKMPDGDLKDNLQKELAKIDNKLRLAKEAVIKAEKYPNMRSYIIDADNKVKVVKNTVPEKPGLAKRVQDLKDAFNANIENAEYQENLKQATHYTEQAEQYVTKYYIDKAQTYINALPVDDVNRVNLQARLDVANGQYENIVNPPKQNTSAEIKDATKWVEYAEKYRTAVYMNKAQNLVTALSDSPEKDGLQARLDVIVLK